MACTRTFFILVLFFRKKERSFIFYIKGKEEDEEMIHVYFMCDAYFCCCPEPSEPNMSSVGCFQLCPSNQNQKRFYFQMFGRFTTLGNCRCTLCEH